MDAHKFQDHVVELREDTPLVGTVIGGKYRILSHIGTGIVSQVYKACDVASVKTLALKIIAPHHPVSAEVLRPFEHNARLNIHHPNLVSVHACGLTDDGQPWIATEYLQGETLSALLQREGCLSADATFAIFQQVLNVLAYLHGKGEVHMNLKPSNVLLVQTEDGQTFAKLSDFGLSKLLLEQELDAADERAPAVGSPLYMSPEQLRGEAVDSRTDIYAVGCMLFQCLTGRPPHEGLTLLETMDRHFHADMQFPSEPEIAEPIKAVLRKALSKGPAERQRSVTELQQDLEAARAGKSPDAREAEEKARILAEEIRHPIRSYNPPQGMPRRAAKKGNEPWMLLLACVTILLFVLMIQQCLSIMSDMNYRGLSAQRQVR